MAQRFEWDEEKARVNWLKPGLSFAEATTVFGDPLAFTIADPLHSDQEERFVTTGLSALGRTIVVIHAQRGAVIRIISARRATPRERRADERPDDEH